MRHILKASRRNDLTHSALNDLRTSGQLPAVVYGKHLNPYSIHISKKELGSNMQHGHTELLDMEIEGVGTYQVVLNELQKDPLTGRWLHADFHQVNLDEKIHVKVPIEFTGTAKGTKTGGVVQFESTEIDVEALPEKVPNHIEMSIDDLEIGHALHVSDLKLPADIRCLSKPEEMLVSITLPRAAKSDDAEDETAEEVS